MNNIEFVKLIVYGDINAKAPIQDTDINLINKKQGVNTCIEILATAELNKISDKPSSVSDGAVNMSWSDRTGALNEIVRKARNSEFQAPDKDIHNSSVYTVLI